jgi:hypothetical protein
MCGIETRRQWKYEVRPHKSEFSVAPIDRVSGESRFVAEILHVMATVPTVTINTAHPRDTDTRSMRKIRCHPFDNLAYDLVTRNQQWPNRRQISFNDMQIGTANSTRKNPEQNMSRLEFRTWVVPNLKEWSDSISRRRESCCFQLRSSFCGREPRSMPRTSIIPG